MIALTAPLQVWRAILLDDDLQKQTCAVLVL